MPKPVSASSLQELSRSNLRKAHDLLSEIRVAALASSDNRPFNLTRDLEDVIRRLEFVEGECRSYCNRLASRQQEEPENTQGKVNRGRRN